MLRIVDVSEGTCLPYAIVDVSDGATKSPENRSSGLIFLSRCTYRHTNSTHQFDGVVAYAVLADSTRPTPCMDALTAVMFAVYWLYTAARCMHVS